MTDIKPLTKRNRKFLAEYYKDFNATRAYMKVYPESSYDAARSSSAELLTKPNIKAEIEAHLKEVQMSADEALMLTAEIARGDLGDFLSIGSEGFSFDLESARDADKTKLIRRISQKTVINNKNDTETTFLDIELYDRQGAIRDILRMHGRFVEKVDVTSQGESIASKMTDEERLTQMKKLAVMIAEVAKDA